MSLQDRGYNFTPDNTLGALVLGLAASCFVYGICVGVSLGSVRLTKAHHSLLTQVWTYYHRYLYDARRYKFLVGLIVLLETVDQGFITHFAYYYTVTSAGKPLSMATGNMKWSPVLQQMIGNLVGITVKCVFAVRVYRFSQRNLWISSLIVVLSLSQLCFSLWFTVKAFEMLSISAVFGLEIPATTSLALGVFTDITIAASLSFFLRRLRSGIARTDSLVRRLVRDAINIGILTSTVSLTTLLLFDLSTGNLVFGATYFLLSKRA
ncbi:unnamed protein product [Mycena citricolor]|uniref:DUF6534 domain-containing protein n=1 Tax=Mycena citricolor TaxID=2018698 RepID=A0AAD2K386_9AGAR|nr:unnamed protein product [Mycena citricolor]